MSVLFVTGTGTEVGKTWFATRVITALRAGGTAVVARKPAQSFEPDTGPTDADLLGAASGEDPRTVCPAHRWYEVPMAPPMAAAVLGRPAITVADLVREFVEGAGKDVTVAQSAKLYLFLGDFEQYIVGLLEKAQG